jgi:protein gp37
MTKIEWTELTWNPIVGCSKVSAGCQNCYAEKMAGRLANMGKVQYQQVVNKKTGRRQGYLSRWNGKVAFYENAIEKPLHWKKPRMIFVCSMGDLFHKSVPFEWIDRVMAVIALCPQHTFQVLTKQEERMKEYFDTRKPNMDCGNVSVVRKYLCKFELKGHSVVHLLPNLWLGVTAENQEMADKRIPVLLETPAAKRFVSYEPALGPVYLKSYLREFYIGLTQEEKQHALENAHCGLHRIIGVDWVIVGAESGSNRRPCKHEWIDSVVEQCKAADVLVFVKQAHLNGKLIKPKDPNWPKRWPQEMPE